VLTLGDMAWPCRFEGARDLSDIRMRWLRGWPAQGTWARSLELSREGCLMRKVELGAGCILQCALRQSCQLREGRKVDPPCCRPEGPGRWCDGRRPGWSPSACTRPGSVGGRWEDRRSGSPSYAQSGHIACAGRVVVPGIAPFLPELS
jgi:hypothetical protein